MTNYIYITLDTTAPSNPMVSINGGAINTTNQLVNLAISVGDSDTTGYQMKLWGDVDETHSVNINKLEGSSNWVPYDVSPQIKLSLGDGTKTINLKVRDDVHNPSSIALYSITLDTKIPTVTTTAPDVNKISKVAGKDVFSFNFSADKLIKEYKVKLVGITNATHDAGVDIPTEGGSSNTKGVDVAEGKAVAVTIKGADLEAAGASDGVKIIKVFVKDINGQWSA